MLEPTPQRVNIDPRCSKCGTSMPHKEGATIYCCMRCSTANKVTETKEETFGTTTYSEPVCVNAETKE